MVTHTPITPTFGALIEGIDPNRLHGPALRQLYELWQRQHVVVLRGAKLTSEQLVAFASRIGEVEGSSESLVGDTRWDADLSWAERPPFACLARAIDIMPGDGATWFANMPAALRSMPAELAGRLRWFAIQHGPTLHPIVVMQPETGEPTLYLGDRRGAKIDGLPAAESERLLNIVWSYATAASVTLCHRWQPDDIVLWNNLTTMHRHDPNAEGAVRRIQRVRFKGRYTLTAPIQKEAA